MKVGVISRGSPDYLIDIVTDGLIRLLGRDHVSLDYNVRGGWGGQYKYCLQNISGPEPFDIHDADFLIASTRSFDAIEAWMKVTRKRVALVDGEDDSTIRDALASRAQVYFKREYLKDVAYASNVLPLQFAALPEPMPNPPEITSKVFYRGHRSHHERLEVEDVLASMGYQIGSRIEKEEYNRLLASSLVGISVRGGGWDTYRYWEIPYFATALLSQRLPIRIPGDFEEGREVVYFNQVSDLKLKLEWMLSDPDRTFKIGQAGRVACLARHMSTHRAKTVLEAIS